MSGEQEGIVWKKFKNLPMADGRSAGDKSAPDYSRFGARLQREIYIPSPFTALSVYEMPDDLFRAPTALELQLFEPALFLPDAPTAPTRLSSQVGRLHARIFWSVGNTGPMRVDCDWIGSLPIVAHKALSVSVVADRFSTVDPPASFSGAFTFDTSTAPGNPGTAQISLDVALPVGGTPITVPPTKAFLSRTSGAATDAAAFTATQTNERLTLTVAYSTGDNLVFSVASVVEHATHLELVIGSLVSYSNVTTLDNNEAVTVTLAWEAAPLTRIDVAVALLVGGRAPWAPPTYTFPATPLAPAATATFPVPAFARKLRCSLKWGVAGGSAPDAVLGQYYVAFISRGFGSLAWIDAASAREGLFGDGIAVPPGTHAVMLDNRSPDPLDVMPSFVLGL